jgi:hypothetical protein
MKRRNKKKMLGNYRSSTCIIGIMTVFFNIPYSKTRTEFSELISSLLTEMPNESSVFTEEDIAHLPLPVQKYFRYCGYIGTPKMSFMKAIYQDVDFLFGKDKPTIKIDYTQYNFVNEPIRIAYIDSSMYGIPFEGLDSYTAGNGSMKGVLAKLFTLFNQTGENMDKASLVTYLSECLIIPNVALQDLLSGKKSIIYMLKLLYPITVLLPAVSLRLMKTVKCFPLQPTTGMATAIDGTSEKVKWSAVCSGYVETNGIRRPTVLQAIWHYDDGDLVYFDGKTLLLNLITNK